MSIPIYHLSSHARAGETVFLRHCDAHSQIHVPLQVRQEEDPEAQAFVRRVQQDEIQAIPCDDPYAKRAQLTHRHVILIKQGVWAPNQFQGFGLVRNPLSFVASMLEYNRKEGLTGAFRERKKYHNTFERLLRWSAAMDTQLHAKIDCETKVIPALCQFYVHRVNWIKAHTELVFTYEQFVSNPAEVLGQACTRIGLPYENQMLEAHQQFSTRDKGHGMNDLSRALDQTSLHKWRETLDPRDVELVEQLTGYRHV